MAPSFEIPYGKSSLPLTLSDTYDVELIAPRDTAPAPDPTHLAKVALANPVGHVPSAEIANARSAAIAVSDKTRLIPHAALVTLLARLEELGLPPQAITLFIATGTHTPMQPYEFGKVLPKQCLGRYRVISHDCDDQTNLVWLGTTQRGTPVWANNQWMQADLRIVVGNIEPHQFMGFSGGAKSAAIGLTGRETINHNHAMMNDPLAALGEYDNNPVRQDVEEIGQLLGIHFALNTVLNPSRQIVHVLAGAPAAVMQAGIPLVRELYEVKVPAAFDLVISSPGGHPKDINLYQAQKAFAHAALISREGGSIILVAACPEGTGSERYETWVAGMPSHSAVLERFAREEFRLGPHKAFQISRDAAHLTHAILVSDMAPERVRHLLLTPARNLESALALVQSTLSPGARIGVMPAANATVPALPGMIR